MIWCTCRCQPKVRISTQSVLLRLPTRLSDVAHLATDFTSDLETCPYFHKRVCLLPFASLMSTSLQFHTNMVSRSFFKVQRHSSVAQNSSICVQIEPRNISSCICIEEWAVIIRHLRPYVPSLILATSPSTYSVLFKVKRILFWSKTRDT